MDRAREIAEGLTSAKRAETLRLSFAWCLPTKATGSLPPDMLEWSKLNAPKHRRPLDIVSLSALGVEVQAILKEQDNGE